MNDLFDPPEIDALKSAIRERFPLAFPPASHTLDPESSHIAERSITASGVRATQMARVLDAVKANPGRTSRELSQISGLDRYMVARRTADLEHVGACRKGPTIKCTVAGKLAVTWFTAS